MPGLRRAESRQQKDVIELIPGRVREELDMALAQRGSSQIPPPTPGKTDGDSNSCNQGQVWVSVRVTHRQMALASERKDGSFPAWVTRQG